MTDADVLNAIEAGFLRIYGDTLSSLLITGIGTETIEVAVTFPDHPPRFFSFELPSDDDGYFYFRLNGYDVTLRMPYPEGQ